MKKPEEYATLSEDDVSIRTTADDSDRKPAASTEDQSLEAACDASISATADDRKPAAKGDGNPKADDARAARSSDCNEERNSPLEFIRQWEQEAQLHFKKSSWKDVVHACQKVLSVPGQDESNFDVLFKIGYAYMRLEYNETAAKYFQAASRIDSSQITLKFAILELKRKAQTGPWRKKRKSNNDEERPAKR